ncbi:AAA family ATPase [Devosia sp.]|uniref:AAA family ATPase n=1 Tax=Devosia sp. TaxID=1871048 RepID=UPI0027364C50|nr:AAA family ATPase [Devosia sp.]MDP2780065.1 AAA family ATPase [Devosia sp.]
MNQNFNTWQAKDLPTHGTPLANGVYLVSAALIPPLQIDCLWDGWLAKGKFHILAGPAGTGKTTVVLNLAACISSAYLGRNRLPDGTSPPSGKVIIWTGEDGIEDTIIPRLIAAGADLDRVLIIRGIQENGRRRTFDFATDVPKLRNAIEELGDVVLIIIDSIVQAVAGDSNKNSAVRKSLAPLVELGEHNNCAILGVTHVNKGSKGKEPIDRVNGSLAYTAVARVVWLTVKVISDCPDDNTPKCVLVRAKTNIGKNHGGFAYQIHPAVIQGGQGPIKTSMLTWDQTPLQGSAESILRQAEAGGNSESISAVDEAREFLTGILAHGGLAFPEIESRSRAAGISMGAIKRAKSVLRITSHKQMGVGQASPSVWCLAPVQERSTAVFTPAYQHGALHAPYVPGSTALQSAANSSANVAGSFTLADHARSYSHLENERPQLEPAPIRTMQTMPETQRFDLKNAASVESVDSPVLVTSIFDNVTFEYQMRSCVHEVCKRYRNGAHDDDANDPEAFQERVIEESIQAVLECGLDYGEVEKYRKALGGIDWVAQLQQTRPH